MTLKRMDNVLIVVNDLEAAKAFFKRDTTAHAGDPFDCGAPGEYVLAHGGHSTRKGPARASLSPSAVSPTS